MIKLPTFNDSDPKNRDFKTEQALVAAFERAFAPVVKEINDTIKTVRKMNPDTPNKEAVNHSITFAIERFEEAVKEMSVKERDKNGQASDDDIVKSLRTFTTANWKEQKSLVMKMLSNESASKEILKDLKRIFEKEIKRDIHKIIEISALSTTNSKKADEELLKLEKFRDKEAEKERNARKTKMTPQEKGDKSTSVLGKLYDLLTSDRFSAHGFIAAISSGLAELAMAVGTIGLFKMLPQQAQDIFTDFTTKLATVKVLLSSSFLKPIMQILEHIPIVGAIMKKIPFLGVLLAAVNVIPEMIEKYKVGGWSVALDHGLKRFYDFFIGDLVGMVTRWADKLQSDMFGVQYLDFTAWGESFNVSVKKLLGSISEFIVNLADANWAGIKASATKVVFDIVDGITNPILALFKMPPIDSTKFFTEITTSVVKFAKDYLSPTAVKKFFTDVWDSVTSWTMGKINSGVEAIKDSAEKVSNMFSIVFDIVKRKVVAATEYAFDKLMDVPNLIKDMFMSIWSVITEKFNAALKSATDLFSFSRWTEDQSVQIGNSTTVLHQQEGATKNEEKIYDRADKLDKAKKVKFNELPSSSVNVKNEKNSSSTIYNFSVPDIKAGLKSPTNGFGTGGGW